MTQVWHKVPDEHALIYIYILKTNARCPRQLVCYCYVYKLQTPFKTEAFSDACESTERLLQQESDHVPVGADEANERRSVQQDAPTGGPHKTVSAKWYSR